jgi:hypothetical protein
MGGWLRAARREFKSLAERPIAVATFRYFAR